MVLLWEFSGQAYHSDCCLPAAEIGGNPQRAGVVKIEDCRQNWQAVTVQLGIMGSPGS
jgi:hypothetical protein